MPAELHLPDLPEVPISLGSTRVPGPPPPPMPWPLRLREALAAYLPLLLMGALALASWWLVRNTPGAAPAASIQAVRDEPDYTMRRFVVQRFGADGLLKVQLEGLELRHYADGAGGGAERIEIDQVELRAWTDDGRLTTASARRGVASVDARVVTLAGGAQLHGSDEAGQAVEVRSEFLEARLDEGIVRTDQPVQVVHGTQQLSAAGLVYERDRGRLRFDGPVRARLAGARR